MNLGKLIHDLLERQPTVFVKNLGTFKRTHTSASFDAKRNVMLPPINFIEFEYQAEEGYDFTLHYQQANQLDKNDAEEKVQQAVSDLADVINRDGQASLDELGHLISYGYAYVFKPLDLSGFQYVPIQDPYLKVEEELEEVPTTPAEDTVEETIEEEIPEVIEEDTIPEEVMSNEVAEQTIEEPEIVETVQEETPISQVEEVEQSQEANQEEIVEEHEPKKSRGWIYAVITVLALTALGFLLYNLIIKKELDNVNSNLGALDTLEDVADTLSPFDVDSSALAPIDTLQADSIIQHEAIEEAPISESIVTDKYTIVIGTHKTLAQAEAEAAEYNRKGHRSVRALASNLAGNRKKVIWDTYPTKELRDSALRYVRKNIQAEAWGTELN